MSRSWNAQLGDEVVDEWPNAIDIRISESDPTVGWTNAEDRPLYVEALGVMRRFRDLGIVLVLWRVLPGGQVWTVRRCECGEVTVDDLTCPLCRALASLVVDRGGADDLQARYEAAERYMDRVGAVIAELKRQIERAPGGRSAQSPVEVTS